MDSTKRLMHVFETYTIENCAFCQKWFCAQAYVKVGAGALHRGTGKTKQNANTEFVYINSRENCGVVDRREIDGKKKERKPRLTKINKPWMKRNICKENSIGNGSSQTLAESGESF